MLKITLEDDSGLVGFKDNHAWTYEDATKMFQEIAKQAFDMPKNKVLVWEDKKSLTNPDDSALNEGM